MRIAVHDYAGHPFQFSLSRELARRGHQVRHFYFAGDIGPKGASATTPDDPPTFSIEPLSIAFDYRKADFIRRRQGDILYGRTTAAALAKFAPDVIISGNTPLDAQGRLVRAAHRAPSKFVFWMQDFYSLAIERIVGKRWLGLGRAIAGHYAATEARLLRASDAVVSISENFMPQLARLGVRPDKVTTIPNWGAIESIPLRSKQNPWSIAHGLDEKFVFLYSGTLALKHDPELLWRLAATFEGRDDVRVVVAASGVSADVLKARHAANPKRNLVFLPLQPIEAFPDMLGAADVLIALLEPDAGAFSVPSKVLSYLCAGRAILLSAPQDNLAAVTLAAAQSGLSVRAGDATEFIAAAERLRRDLAARQAMGAAARRYAERNFRIEAVATAFEQVFERVCSPASASARSAAALAVAPAEIKRPAH